MAEIDIERKSGSRLPLILGVVLGLLVLWGLYEVFDSDEADVTRVGVSSAPVPPPVVISPMPAADAVAIPVTAILTDPARYGAPLDGSAKVTEVPTDRGFWIDDGGRRMFAVIDEPTPETKNINPGQTVLLKQARVYRSEDVGSIPGELTEDTKRIIESVPAVLYVQARNIQIAPGA